MQSVEFSVYVEYLALSRECSTEFCNEWKLIEGGIEEAKS
jgi:hypothetical protein